MSNKLFEMVDGFFEGEAWGDADKLNGLLVLLLAMARKWFSDKHGADIKFMIHCAYESSGHATDSQHDWALRDFKGNKLGGRIGNAVDFHIEGLEMSFSKQVSEMLECLGDLQVLEVVGLGIYPDWNNQGFHLDVRGYQSRWGRIEHKYVSIGEALAHAVGKERVE